MKYLLLLSFLGLALAASVPVAEKEHEGVCPVDYVYPGEDCITDCQADSGCDEGLKCCQTDNCGKKCVATETNDEKTKEEITKLLTTILEERTDLTEKLEKYPPPMLRFIAMKNRTDVIRLCVTSPCEARKCQRIAQEITYNVEPRKEVFCQKATSTEQCLFWAERGWTDVVIAREEKVFVAKTKFNVTAVAQEVIKDENMAQIEKVTQSISVAIKLATNDDVETLAQLEGKKVCSAGIEEKFSFVSPVCTLVKKGIIPQTGDCLESAGDFFGDMCVPGTLDKKVNKNETLPEKFETLCTGDDKGYKKALHCVNTNNAITFVDHKVVKEMLAIPEYVDSFRLVCEGDSRPLSSWVDKVCQVGYIPRPIVFVNPDRNVTYITDLHTILNETVKMASDKTNPLNIFSSEEYVCPEKCDTVGKECDKKNLIFRDDSQGFLTINETIVAQNITVQKYFKTYNVCKTLVPKPTARFCVVGEEKYQKCVEMKKVFDKNIKLTKIAWGCILGKTKLDCMRNVLNGTADIYGGDAKDIFVGGNDLMLQPFMMQDVLNRTEVTDYTQKIFGTHSVAIMKKTKLVHKYYEGIKVLNLRNLSVCSAGIDKVESFHLPVGRLLSNNVIPRIGSVFESVNRFFKESCFPGASPKTYKHDLDVVLGHELNWGIPGLNFFNFTGHNWFVWNSPHTWNFYNYNRKTPGSLQRFMKNRLLVPILEGKLSLPDEFDAKTFDYNILEEVLGVEGLGDILSDIPDKIRDQLVENRVSKKSKATTFKDLYEDRTGTRFVSGKDKRLSRQTMRSYMQKSFENMQDEWGVFTNVEKPMTARNPSRTLTGGQVTDVRRFLDGRVEDADPNSVINNLLKDYDSEYTVPIISKIFVEVLERRFTTLYGLAESMNVLRNVPAMTNIHGEEYKWINHPSVQAFVRIYAPRLATYHSDLFDNSETQALINSRYLNPIWLTPTFPEFLDTMKTHMEELTTTCMGFRDIKGHPEDSFAGVKGALKCIADSNEGDIALVGLEELQDYLEREQMSITDYVIVTPLGIVKEINNNMLSNITFLGNVTFGVKAYPALMTAFNKTGTWRWNVTKALMEAQKIYSTHDNTPSGYTMFGSDKVFDSKTRKLVPIPLQDQVHQVYLGPNLTRSFEAIIKPSTYDFWKERRQICSGEVFSNVIEHNNGTCKAVIKDVTCGGMPRPKVINVGTTEHKKPVVVRMCSRPTRFIREMAEFRCDNGHGYLTPVMIPTTCQCVPCEEIEYQPDWTKDHMWTTTDRMVTTEDVETEEVKKPWGNEEFWTDHTLNKNFQIGEPKTEEEMTGSIGIGSMTIKPLDTCEANWYGFRWNKEWFPKTNRPVCLGSVTGLRRVLTQERIKTKVLP